MGILRWLKKQKEEFKNQEPVSSIKIGGGGLSVSQNRKLQRQTIRGVMTETAHMDERDILRNYDVLGEDSSGKLVIRKKRKVSQILSEDEISAMLDDDDDF